MRLGNLEFPYLHLVLATAKDEDAQIKQRFSRRITVIVHSSNLPRVGNTEIVTQNTVHASEKLLYEIPYAFELSFEKLFIN